MGVQQARRRAGRLTRPLVSPVLQAGDRVASRLSRVGRARAGAPTGLAPRPTACIAAIAAWYDAGRIDFLITTVTALRAQAPDGACAVITNEPARLADALRSRGLAADGAVVREVELDDAPAFLLELGHRIAVIPWRARHDPFRLPWLHKRLFHALTTRHDAFASGVSHLVYVEDDLRLADGALGCWCALRPLLAPHGLLPGFLRVEDDPASMHLTDLLEPELVADRPSVSITVPLTTATTRSFAPWDGATLTCANLSNPYQACSVLDADLARAHFDASFFRSYQRSRLSTELGSTWKVREKAAAGAIFDDVPAGFVSRNVVPLVDGGGGLLRPLDACLVEHLPANYVNDPGSPFGTVALAEAFPSPRMAGR